MTTYEELYIGLGSNLGNREHALKQAVLAIHRMPSTEVLRCSPIYETEPVGYTNQPAFLNMTVAARTGMLLSPFFQRLLEVEGRLGRIRDVRWGPRVIDLDMLLVGERRMESPILTIPHPRMFERVFVLVPLLDVLRKGNHWFVLANEALDKLESKEGIALWKKVNWLGELELSES